MNLKLVLVLSIASVSNAAVGEQSEIAMGRSYYAEGQFKRAAAHFQRGLVENPNDADACFGAGMSYQMLADIAAPFNHKYSSKARGYLTKATELAPTRQDYRSELFNFLLDAAGSSRAARRQAEAILERMPESDPEYPWMHRRLEQEGRADASTDARLGRLFLSVPRALYQIVELPAGVVSSRPEHPPLTAVQ
jgi:tetratricopeptide (TPR) repeat protein